MQHDDCRKHLLDKSQEEFEKGTAGVVGEQAVEKADLSKPEELDVAGACMLALNAPLNPHLGAAWLPAGPHTLLQ